MLAKVTSGAVIGIDGYLVEVEVDLAQGIPGFDIVGLPDSAVKESRERVRTAVRNADYPFPVKRITVNLAPADIRKSGPAFDLPIAAGILIGTRVLSPKALQGTFITGELSLDGMVRPVSGVLPMVLAARNGGLHTCFVPSQNAEEAALVEGVEIYPISHISQLVKHFEGEKISPVDVNVKDIFHENAAKHSLDFADVKGQKILKRAMEVAAAGYHNMLMVGPPGTGKTMLATRIPTIMPDLDFDECVEITKIYSIAGLLDGFGASNGQMLPSAGVDGKIRLVTNRPFRAPHHTASKGSIVGGGNSPKPGEISLAHNGVLFLDELTEFQKTTLETLRQPLEEGKVTIARTGGVITYPSTFLMLASMNPCPCGYYGTDRCRCSPHEVTRYLSKISSPLLDRLDIQCEAAAVEYKDLNHERAETSAEIKKRVMLARQLQRERFANDGISVNAHMPAVLVDKYCPLGKKEEEMVRMVFDSMGLSMRAYHKILKISRTIADLEGADNISEMHIAEAISYRELDRKYWHG